MNAEVIDTDLARLEARELLRTRERVRRLQERIDEEIDRRGPGASASPARIVREAAARRRKEACRG